MGQLLSLSFPGALLLFILACCCERERRVSFLQAMVRRGITRQFMPMLVPTDSLHHFDYFA